MVSICGTLTSKTRQIHSPKITTAFQIRIMETKMTDKATMIPTTEHRITGKIHRIATAATI